MRLDGSTPGPFAGGGSVGRPRFFTLFLAMMVLTLMAHRSASIDDQLSGRGGGGGGGGGIRGRGVIRTLDLSSTLAAREAYKKLKGVAPVLAADVKTLLGLARREGERGVEALVLAFDDESGGPHKSLRVYAVADGVPAQIVAPKLLIDAPKQRVSVVGHVQDDPHDWWRKRYHGVNKTLLRVLVEELGMHGLSIRLLQPNEPTGSGYVPAFGGRKPPFAPPGLTRIWVDLFASRIPATVK